MAKEAPWKNRIRSVILLALFYFLFLGSEYLFDNSIIYHTDSHGVVIAQSYILGISTLGFLFLNTLPLKQLPVSDTSAPFPVFSLVPHAISL